LAYRELDTALGLTDRLSDGGSGSAERVVPDDFGTDWTAEIGNCDVRMKEETQPSNENNGKQGRCVSASGSIGWLGTKNRRGRGPCQRKVTF
jgi:hypothetical protein